ncbi:microtubule-binding protein MIP-T3-domain-containing protein [Fimicolochytrium jonesii]|uniref:microtubule-binding protein MIP-T3-domain-containing protein n=1 Tax=Fimicolochytrium jonesii TaxID=1396493 RepID=UPI0022FEB680|nr:microtubule-binding protein MIP-T3-domain-containing protein [Fimicolochytrium jonesii]KAI8822013.1 microtubule-binding protein MIP-T3-domain-containing protein [Fimicolochytrium jonesii]
MASSLEETVAQSIEILTKVVKKTPLTPKLLSKPPFRYLHDLISEVISTSDFGSGLFTEDESKSENVKDKEAKVAYLTKIIDCVGIATEADVKANPLKIVAGLEAEETNAFLQALGRAAVQKVESSDAVKRVLAGEHQGAAPKRRKSRDASVGEKPAGEKLQATRVGKSTTNLRGGKSDASLEKQASSAAVASSSKKSKENLAKGASQSNLSKDKDEAKPQTSPRKSRDNLAHRESDKSDIRKSKDALASTSQSNLREKRERDKESAAAAARGKSATRKEGEESKPTPSSAPPAAMKDKGLDSRSIPAEPEQIEQPRQDVSPPPSARREDREAADKPPAIPSSAPSAPSDDLVPDESVRAAAAAVAIDSEDRQARMAATTRRMRPASARPAPPRQRAPEVALEEVPKNVPTIYTDTKQDDPDDFVVIAHDADDIPTFASAETTGGPLADEHHGGLVRTILQTKQDLEGSKDGNGADAGADMRAKSGPKDRAGGIKEIEALRESIQALTRSTNPLGKTMDYMQEDVDSMNRELEMWRSEHLKYLKVYEEELRISAEELAPLESQLKAVEAAIEEQLDVISTTKASIIQNETMVQTLLQGISKGGV